MLLLFVLGIGQGVFAQFQVVKAPELEILLTKQNTLQEFMKVLEKQGLELNLESLEEIKKIEENIRKVSDLVRTGKDAVSIAKTYGQLMLEATDTRIRVNQNDMISENDKKIISKMMDLVIEESNDAFSKFELITKDDAFKLSDYERLDLLGSIKKELTQLQVVVAEVRSTALGGAERRRRKLSANEIFKG